MSQLIPNFGEPRMGLAVEHTDCSGDPAAKGVADVMEAADIALYRAKSAGRNQAVLFTSDMRADRYPATVEAAQIDAMADPQELIAADREMVLTPA